MPRRKKVGKAGPSEKPENSLGDIDEIAKATHEIDQEIEKQRNRPKNKRTEKKSGTERTAVKADPGGRGIEPMQNELEDLELDQLEPRGGAARAGMDELVNVLIEHLDKFGACVIDDFLGEKWGNQILADVLSIENLKAGELASLPVRAGRSSQTIRSDQMAWTDGLEPPCPGICHLTKVLDAIVMTANRRPNNGPLAAYTITGRTKAMVACYPGAGTHYITHVDNPNKDGRIITAIYYLNKDWSSATDGGTLRIFSKAGEGPVAEVEPLFDRMLFFWSDRRNPHEVRPTFRDRFAVTVWYMDHDERKDYEERQKQQGQPEGGKGLLPHRH